MKEIMKETKIDFTRVRDLDNGFDMFGILNNIILKPDDIAQLVYDNPYVEMRFCAHKGRFDIWEMTDIETARIISVNELVGQKVEELVEELTEAIELTIEEIQTTRNTERYIK